MTTGQWLHGDNDIIMQSSNMTETYFFPNQSPETINLATRFRKEVAKLPQDSRLILYEILSSCHPTFVPTTFLEEAGMVIARQCDREIAFPNPIPMGKLTQVMCGFEELLRRKYCLPGFVEVERGDIVVDCGAYVGGFSFSAARIAEEVHAFEPEAANFACLVRNFTALSHMTLNEVGLYSDSKTMNLNISASSVEHSLLMPDDGPPIEIRPIQVVALQDYCRAKQLNRLDFVKIEAEGVELEIFDGLGSIRPRKLAIDVSAERNGESPAEEFLQRLEAVGYLVRQRGHVMFARKEG
jgi:FkbM family methyltransferase